MITSQRINDHQQSVQGVRDVRGQRDGRDVREKARLDNLNAICFTMLVLSNPWTEVGMTSDAVVHLRPSLKRRAKEVHGRAAG